MGSESPQGSCAHRNISFCPDCGEALQRYERGREWERDRLVRMAHAMEAERMPMTAANFERLANMVIEEGPVGFSSEPTDEGVLFRMQQDVRIKDVRDA